MWGREIRNRNGSPARPLPMPLFHPYETIWDFASRHIPYVGDYVAPGWERVGVPAHLLDLYDAGRRLPHDALLVECTGLRTLSDCCSLRDFIQLCNLLVAEGPGQYALGVLDHPEHGRFVVLGLFRRAGAPLAAGRSASRGPLTSDA